ncbi:hypothetical protein pb186bvf_007219 [Paramecium bursaria]
MQATNLVINFSPPQIGIVYQQPNKKKKIYKIDFNGMEKINDSEKIASILYSNHSLYFNEQNIPKEQVIQGIEQILQTNNSSRRQKKSSLLQYGEYDDDDIDL